MTASTWDRFNEAVYPVIPILQVLSCRYTKLIKAGNHICELHCIAFMVVVKKWQQWCVFPRTIKTNMITKPILALTDQYIELPASAIAVILSFTYSVWYCFLYLFIYFAGKNPAFINCSVLRQMKAGDCFTMNMHEGLTRLSSVIQFKEATQRWPAMAAQWQNDTDPNYNLNLHIYCLFALHSAPPLSVSLSV